MRKKNFEDFDTTVVLKSNQKTALNVQLKSNILYLSINTLPAGAEVMLDDELLGTTPLYKEIDFTNNKLYGIKKIRIHKEDSEEIEQEIILKPSFKPDS